MSETTIKVRNIGKKYMIGEKSEYSTMRENIALFASKSLKKLLSGFRQNPATRANKSSGKPGLNSSARMDGNETKSNYFWSLKDISFNVNRGEIVGIIGRNGAGKSTLLKVITGITEPNEGRIDIYGRIASLLEVGTGFHQELTGRENIFLNGAILGMRKREIESKFDEIVDFSEIGRFIDTPVKYYSSGMRVRLGFSVAAHLEPEILLIDEVLAVGDAAFQKKCLGKLNNVASSEGRTVLFVSHDMTAVLALCPKSVILEHGRMIAEGSTGEIVQQYMQSMSAAQETPLDQREDRRGDGSALVTSLRVENIEARKPIRTGSSIKIEFNYVSDNPIKYPRLIVKVSDFRTRANLIRFDSEMQGGLPELLPATGKIICMTRELFLSPGRCIIDVELKRGTVTADKVEYAGQFDIETDDLYGTGKLPSREQAAYLPKYEWDTYET